MSSSFPYFVIPLIEQYRNCDPISEKGRNIAARIILNTGDPDIIARFQNISLPPVQGNQNSSDYKYLIKNHRYSEALKIIEEQNLNNSEKNAYFAHQIRFLKKLIVLENNKNKTNGPQQAI